MKLKELIYIVRNGELAQLLAFQELTAVEQKDKTLRDAFNAESLEKVISLINLALTQIRLRFPIEVKEHIVDLRGGKAFYDMPSDFMGVNYVYNEFGREVPINEDPDDFDCVFFPAWNRLQVPHMVHGDFLSIIYISEGERYTSADLEKEVDLPAVLIDALTSYVGYRGHTTVTGDARGENTAHLQRFELNCLKAEEKGLVYPTNSLAMNSRLADRGFV